MKRHLLALATILSLLPLTSAAHKQWLVPSATVVAGNDAWVTVDAAVSNQLYFPDHVPMRLDNVTIVAPDGRVQTPRNPTTGKYRSVFDVQLDQEGTYRIANVNAGLSARWDTPESLAAASTGTAQAGGNGSPRGGFLRNATPEQLATQIPGNARNLKVTEILGRVETFVTHGSPSTITLTGKGLELLPVTHPNDLFAGDEATFRLMVDGKPASGVDIEIIRGGTRYRNAQDEIKVTTGTDGSFKVRWPEPGMYWLEASTIDNQSSVPQATQRRLGYTATLEVLPQ